MFEKYKVILWDFDGVIMDSMPIRSSGFALVLKNYPAEQVNQLMDFHNQNGGLSRYVKFRYFFETIRGESITDGQLQELANSFSEIMLNSLINKELLIKDAVAFIEANFEQYEMHIVSGSDGVELNKICAALDLSKYFKSVHGSPTPKSQLVELVIRDNHYNKKSIVLIGDSKNDLDAAIANNISFYGYNNMGLKTLNPSIPYLEYLYQND